MLSEHCLLFFRIFVDRTATKPMNAKKPITIEAALHRAAALCSRGEQAPADVHDKLMRWGLNAADAHQVVTRLRTENFLSDERFAVAFVRDKFRFNGWGRIKIAFMLRQKQLPAAVIDDALQQIDAEEYRTTLDRLLQSRVHSLAGRPDEAARASLLRFAAGRGFEPAVFYPAVDCALRQAGYGQSEE